MGGGTFTPGERIQRIDQHHFGSVGRATSRTVKLKVTFGNWRFGSESQVGVGNKAKDTRYQARTFMMPAEYPDMMWRSKREERAEEIEQKKNRP